MFPITDGMDRSGTTSVSVVPDDTNVDNLSRSLHRDTLKFSETVLKLGGCVGGLEFYQTFIQKQLITSSIVILVLGFFFPGLIHCVIVIVHIGIITFQLVQLNVDDPLFVLLGHQPGVFVLAVGVVLASLGHLLLLLQHPGVQERIARAVGRSDLFLAKCFVIVSVVTRSAVTQYSQRVDVAGHQVTSGHALISIFFKLGFSNSRCPKCFFISSIGIIVSKSLSLMSPILSLVIIILVLSGHIIVELVVMVLSVISSPVSVTMVVVIVLSLLIMFQLLLKTLLKLLLIGQSRRMSELLMLLHLLLFMMIHLLLVLRSLSISHARIIEVVYSRVDVTYVTSSLNHHGAGSRLVLLDWRPRSSVHHLGLKVSQGLHTWHNGWGECRRSGGCWKMLRLGW